LAELALDVIKLADIIERDLGTATRLGLGLGHVLEVAPRMRETAGMDQALRLGDAIIGLIAVGQQNALEAQEQTPGDFGAARGRIVEEQNLAFRRAAGTHPHKMIARRRLVAAQDLQRGFITVNERSIEEVIVQQIDDRDHRLGELDHPIGRGRARQVQADAVELLLLAIER